MNIIVICIDTLRADFLGYNGNQRIQTPSIDGFARRATIFDRAYCGSFPTIPVRTDCFTGNTNFPRYGWKALGEEEVILTEVLRKAGYHTCLALDTLNMLGSKFDRGFHEVIPIKKPPENTTTSEEIVFPVPRENIRGNGEQYANQMADMSHFRHESDWFAARTMRSASEWLEGNFKQEKFFLWVDTFEPHEVWHAPSYYVDLYDPDYKGLDYNFPNYGYTDIYTKKELRHLRAHYAAEVTLTDRWVGHLLRQIEILGLFKNTVIVLFGDHGMLIGEHNRTGKHTVSAADPWPLYEEVAHIPLLVWVPHLKKKRISALVQPADLMPTLLDICKIKGPQMHGRSWLPLLTGKTRKNWEFIFSSTCNWPDIYYCAMPTITGKKWTLVIGREKAQSQLYDLISDPAQKRNLIKKYPNIARKMHSSFLDFMQSCGAEPGYINLYRKTI